MRVLGYEGARAGLATILASQMETSFFPVSLRELPSAISIEELKEMEFSIGKVRVRASFVNHPNICVGYRLYTTNGSIAYLPDNEPYEVLKVTLATREHSDLAEARAYAVSARASLVEFLRSADVLIIDSQYTDDEYLTKIGWGHGYLSSVVSLALDAEVRKLFLFHHDPGRADKAIDAMVESARMLVLESGRPMEVDAAREGAEVWLGAKASMTP
jgi:ribonuclease BN (tRNA processing enzyme)